MSLYDGEDANIPSWFDLKIDLLHSAVFIQVNSKQAALAVWLSEEDKVKKGFLYIDIIWSWCIKQKTFSHSIAFWRPPRSYKGLSNIGEPSEKRGHVLFRVAENISPTEWITRLFFTSLMLSSAFWRSRTWAARLIYLEINRLWLWGLLLQFPKSKRDVIKIHTWHESVGHIFIRA